MLQATKTSYTIGRIKQSLSTFKAVNMEIYEKACLRLPLGFDQGPLKNLCQSPGCVFSLQTPGSKARERRGSHLCSWCDPKVLGARECTIQGVRLIVRGLNKFADKPEVLSAAWKKLSPNFTVQLTMGAATMRERRAMIDEDLVQQCKGRTESYTTESAMCGVCKVKPVGMGLKCLREGVKVFETIAAARAAAAGETRVPIERDADWMRILFAMDGKPRFSKCLKDLLEIDCWPYYCGCLGRRITLTCALCLGGLFCIMERIVDITNEPEFAARKRLRNVMAITSNPRRACTWFAYCIELQKFLLCGPTTSMWTSPS